jgi:hypothetical protein
MATKDEIWEEIEKLTTIEKLELIEYIARSIREELEKDTEID